MEKKNTILLTVIAVATLLVAVIGATFAYFSAKITENNKTQTVIKAAELGITFTGTKEITAVGDVVPGWTSYKTFTVENTSDYDMTFDIYFTDTTNTFTRPQDLVYDMTARYSASRNASVTPGTTEVKMVDNLGNKSAFNIAETQMPATSASAVKIVRVFIQAHTTQEFTMNVEYKYLDIDQNDDQGKEFKTTISIVANGIDRDAAAVKATTVETGEPSNPASSESSESNESGE